MLQCYPSRKITKRLNILSTRPIGIFDSGVGGLTVAKAINKIMPNENLIYFGDIAHTPWGDKPSETIQYYATQITTLLLKHNCKAIVIACNTASSLAFKAVQKYAGVHIFVLNVIDPVVKYLEHNYSRQTIGLIGTKQTIRSKTYQSNSALLDEGLTIQPLETSLLAPLVERGFARKDLTRIILYEYLSNPKLQNISALVLGCTHYPFLTREIKNYYANSDNAVDIIDCTTLTADALYKYLSTHQLRSSACIKKNIFYVSDDNMFFTKVVNDFFSTSIHLKYHLL